ncbi:UrcA family protein [Sphingomonas sp. GCM10030256]|uniref:UrcA family protein n=1 Tax=Sphingomonas sp. GCM10030256 TaxID=3273427 RepID=UPI00360EC1F2
MRNRILAAVLATLSSAALAQPPVIVEATRFPQERVSFADLNLTTEGGVDSLRWRVRGAADRVCNSNSIEVLDTRLKAMRCYRGAISAGFSDIDRIVASRRSGAALAATALVVRAR